MKNTIKLFGIIAVAVIIGFSFVACGPTPQTVTYTGTASGIMYSLKVTENTSQDAYNPQTDDRYELTAGSNKSTGSVSPSNSRYTLVLQPSREGASSFTATVLGNNLTNLTGNTTWDNGTPFTAPGTLTH